MQRRYAGTRDFQKLASSDREARDATGDEKDHRVLCVEGEKSAH